MDPSNIENVFYEISKGDQPTPQKIQNLLSELVTSTHSDNHLEKTVQQHPLGFLCLRWNLDSKQSLRIHIWDQSFDWTQQPKWQIHDHIFKLKSIVLAGIIQNKTYALINNLKRPKWNIYDVEYTNQTSSLIKQKDSGTLKITSSTTYPPGSIYELPAGVLHRSTLRSEFAITALATTINSSNSQKPRVIGNLSDNNLIFSRSISNPQNIRQIIHNSIEYLEGLKVSA